MGVPSSYAARCEYSPDIARHAVLLKLLVGNNIDKTFGRLFSFSMPNFAEYEKQVNSSLRKAFDAAAEEVQGKKVVSQAVFVELANANQNMSLKKSAPLPADLEVAFAFASLKNGVIGWTEFKRLMKHVDSGAVSGLSRVGAGPKKAFERKLAAELDAEYAAMAKAQEKIEREVAAAARAQAAIDQKENAKVEKEFEKEMKRALKAENKERAKAGKEQLKQDKALAREKAATEKAERLEAKRLAHDGYYDEVRPSQRVRARLHSYAVRLTASPLQLQLATRRMLKLPASHLLEEGLWKP